MPWLRQNAQMLSTVASLAMLLVWVIWLQLMYNDYRNRRRPRLVLHQTHGSAPESHCLLINLSQEIIHVQCVQAAAVEEGDESVLQLGSDSQLTDDLGPLELENAIRQGPLAQGQLLRLGTFEDILERLVGSRPAEGSTSLPADAVGNVQYIDIRVAAVYGTSDRTVGARRRFRLEADEGVLKVRPDELYTEQLFDRRQRKVAESWLRRCLET